MNTTITTIKHTDECIGLHTSCDFCIAQGISELTICISEFGATDYCEAHEAQLSDPANANICDSCE